MGEALPGRDVPAPARRGLRRSSPGASSSDRRRGRRGGRGRHRVRAPVARARAGDRIALHVFADPINPPEALAAPPPSRPTVETGWLDAVRDGIAEEMRRNREHHLFRRGNRRARRHLRAHQEISIRSSAPTAWSTRRSPSSASPARRSAPRRPACAASPTSCSPTSCSRRPGRSCCRRRSCATCRTARCAAPMVIRVGAGAVRSAGPHHSRHLSSGLGAYSGPHRLPAVDAGRRQGADEDRAPRRRSGASCWRPKALFASKGPVPEGEHLVPFGVARIARAGDRPHDRQRRAARHRGRSRRPSILAEEGHRGRGDRSAHHPAARRRDRRRRACRQTHRLLVVDEAYAMFGVGAELAPGHERILLRRPGCAGGAAAHGARHASVRAVPRARDARLDGARSSHARDASCAGHADPIDAAGSASGAREARAPAPVGRCANPVSAAPAPSAAPARRHGRRRADHDAVRRSDGERRAASSNGTAELGDRVAAGEHVADIETDKAVVEIESPNNGVLAEILAEEGADRSPWERRSASCGRVADAHPAVPLRASRGRARARGGERRSGNHCANGPDRRLAAVGRRRPRFRRRHHPFPAEYHRRRRSWTNT